MPELLTKYPDITIKVLESAGAKCGKGAPQKILEACPADQFCALPGGELCVYGLDQIGKMTQVKPAELCQARSPRAELIGPDAPFVAVALTLAAVLSLRRAA